jgi:hypothetical protein
MVVALYHVVSSLVTDESGLKLIPQGTGKGRLLPRLGPRIELPNPGAVHIFEEGGNLRAIVLLTHLAAFSHLQYLHKCALEISLKTVSQRRISECRTS